MVVNQRASGRGRLREKGYESAADDGRNDKANNVNSPAIGSSGDRGGRDGGDDRHETSWNREEGGLHRRVTETVSAVSCCLMHLFKSGKNSPFDYSHLETTDSSIRYIEETVIRLSTHVCGSSRHLII
jgi:hypothetical protein